MKHMMVDIETRSSRSNAAVVAIGAVVFDQTGLFYVPGFEVYISPRNAEIYGHVDPATEAWWATQNADVRAKVFSGTIDSYEAFARFIAFVQRFKPDTVWANAPQFDLVILRNLARSLDMQFPMHYRTERDCRTLFDLGRSLGVDLAPAYADAIKHDPLSDAICQAKAVLLCLDRITPRV